MIGSPRWLGVMTMVLFGFSGFACDRPAGAAGRELPEPERDVALSEAPEGEEAEPELRDAVLAAGCFWCVEAVYQQLEGVHQVASGYAGGEAETATYEQVSTGRTGHAEVVRVRYDPSKITFGRLLKVFFATHDPTQLNRQGPDVGPQYRSAIFYGNEEEKQVAEGYIRQLEEAGVFDEPIVTTLEPLEGFYMAEEYHQDFVINNPNHPYVQMQVVPKLQKLRERFEEDLREQEGAPDEE